MIFEYRPSYGRKLFYAIDDDANTLIGIFRSNGHVVSSLTLRQIATLKKFGIKIQISGDFQLNAGVVT